MPPKPHLSMQYCLWLFFELFPWICAISPFFLHKRIVIVSQLFYFMESDVFFQHRHFKIKNQLLLFRFTFYEGIKKKPNQANTLPPKKNKITPPQHKLQTNKKPTGFYFFSFERSSQIHTLELSESIVSFHFGQ